MAERLELPAPVVGAGAGLHPHPRDRQIEEVTEFLHWAETEAGNSSDPQTRAEAEIGVATAREFLARLEQAGPAIYTGSDE